MQLSGFKGIPMQYFHPYCRIITHIPASVLGPVAIGMSYVSNLAYGCLTSSLLGYSICLEEGRIPL